MISAQNQAKKDRVFKDLKRLVNEYLAKSTIQTIGPTQMYLKGALLICSWMVLYILLLCVGPLNWLLGISCLAALLVLTCSWEFCIMHDASHQAFSTNRWVNKLALNFTLAALGGCSVSWHQEHVVRHHGHTNVLGVDPDVYASHVLRLHPSDQWHWWHRWQHIYGMPLFSFMWLHWVFNDFVNAAFNTYQLSRKKLALFWMQIFLGLVPHVIVALVIPYWAFQDVWLVGIGYLSFFMSLSLVMAMTFVLAHVSDGHVFYATDTEAEKDWAVHQLETTTDFAVNNPILTFLLGGLNFQVEHHIFPSVCHLHYPAIQKIVKKYCRENGIVYHEEKTVWAAVKRHIEHLKAMSIPPFPLPQASESILMPTPDPSIQISEAS